jgi:pimeloyl-ACP methyl ester carboxylesterase
MPFIQANGINTYYETAGEGEPLVLLHSDAMSVDVWRRLLPHLAAAPEQGWPVLDEARPPEERPWGRA